MRFQEQFIRCPPRLPPSSPGDKPPGPLGTWAPNSPAGRFAARIRSAPIRAFFLTSVFILLFSTIYCRRFLRDLPSTGGGTPVTQTLYPQKTQIWYTGGIFPPFGEVSFGKRLSRGGAGPFLLLLTAWRLCPGEQTQGTRRSQDPESLVPPGAPHLKSWLPRRLRICSSPDPWRRKWASCSWSEVPPIPPQGREHPPPGGYILFWPGFQDKTADDVVQTIRKSYQAAAAAGYRHPAAGSAWTRGRHCGAGQSNPNLRSSQFSSPSTHSVGGVGAPRGRDRRQGRPAPGPGINVNLAPVADVSTDPSDFIYDRTCGLDAAGTADCVAPWWSRWPATAWAAF